MKTTESDYDFSEMHQRMQFYVDQNILSCCATAVFKGTDLVDHQTFGYMDLETRQPLRDDAIYRMASNTKIVTSEIGRAHVRTPVTSQSRMPSSA